MNKWTLWPNILNRLNVLKTNNSGKNNRNIAQSLEKVVYPELSSL